MPAGEHCSTLAIHRPTLRCRFRQEEEDQVSLSCPRGSKEGEACHWCAQLHGKEAPEEWHRFSNHKNNIFITAGSARNILRSALEEEYPGGLCESSLLSHREGDQRFMLCHCKGKSSHGFPSITGPRDRARWARVVTKSKKKLKP